LAGLPGFAQAPGPVRSGGFELPIFERIAGEVRYAVQPLRRRQRFWWIAERLHAPPERCEHAQAAILLVADLAGRRQQVAWKALRGDIDLAKGRRDPVGHGLLRRLRDLVPVHAPGTGLARQCGDDAWR